jgi:hypothetical protein
MSIESPNLNETELNPQEDETSNQPVSKFTEFGIRLAAFLTDQEIYKQTLRDIESRRKSELE